MACERCKFMSNDKLKEPCSGCIHRPHELCCIGRFEPAEPKVLSAGEACIEEFGNRPLGSREHAYIDGFNEGDKNGQLREWLRPEQVEARKALNKLRGMCTSSNHRSIADRAFKNLKPPYED